MLRVLKNRNYYSRLSDNELIKIFRKKGDKECVGILFNRYTHLVFGICLKFFKNEMESEDTTMEIFEELFEKLQKHNIKNFKSWLYSVARNKCLMILRKNKSIREKKSQILENLYAENVENNLEFRLNLYNNEINMKHKLEKALLQLRYEQQHCLRLMYIENRSYKEISVITGFNLKQVKSYIQNGKRKLKFFLEK